MVQSYLFFFTLSQGFNFRYFVERYPFGHYQLVPECKQILEEFFFIQFIDTQKKKENNSNFLGFLIESPSEPILLPIEIFSIVTKLIIHYWHFKHSLYFESMKLY